MKRNWDLMGKKKHIPSDVYAAHCAQSEGHNSYGGGDMEEDDKGHEDNNDVRDRIRR